jgi:pyrroline-5-carboxylate reductase
METSLPAVAILGTGHMGGAILGGLTQPGVTLESITVTTQSEQSAAVFVGQGIPATSREVNPQANQAAVADADIVLLCVKPYLILELLQEIAPHAKPGAVIVSVAAGITLGSMEKLWPGALMRAMPNTPTQVGRGVTGLAAGSAVSVEQQAWVLALFQTVGQVMEIPESMINALSAFSGSGPAYVYFFIEAFTQVARGYGFSEEQARLMVEETFHGALQLLDSTTASPQALREAVTSPGGTTSAALSVFREADLNTIIGHATAAAIARAEELASE